MDDGYNPTKAMDDALALPKGKSLRLVFATHAEATKFRNRFSQEKLRVRRRDKAAGGKGVSPWDQLGASIERQADGTAALTVSRTSGRTKQKGSHRGGPRPIRIEVV